MSGLLMDPVTSSIRLAASCPSNDGAPGSVPSLYQQISVPPPNTLVTEVSICTPFHTRGN